MMSILGNQITAVQAAALKSTKQGKNLIVLDQTNKQAKVLNFLY